MVKSIYIGMDLFNRMCNWCSYLLSVLYFPSAISCLLGFDICCDCFSPDKSNKFSYDRIKSNLLGTSIGMVLFLIPVPNILLICFDVALTILVGIALKLDNTLRSALAAMVIVLIEGKSSLQLADSN